MDSQIAAQEGIDNVERTNATPEAPDQAEGGIENDVGFMELKQALEDGLQLDKQVHNPDLYRWTDNTWVFFTDGSIIDQKAEEPYTGMSAVWYGPNEKWVGRIAMRGYCRDPTVVEMTALRMCLLIVEEMVSQDSVKQPANVIIWTDSQTSCLRLAHLQGRVVYDAQIRLGTFGVKSPSKVGRAARDRLEQESVSRGTIKHGDVVVPHHLAAMCRGIGSSVIDGDEMVLEQIHVMKNRGIKVHIQWCKGHNGFIGNEVADRGATIASDLARLGSAENSVWRYSPVYIAKRPAKTAQGWYQIAGEQLEALPLFRTTLL